MGVVYPHITIRDTEIPSLLQLDATNNTVLVPIPYVRKYTFDKDQNLIFDSTENSDTIKAVLYDDAQKFIDDWATGGGEWSSHTKDDNIIFDKAKYDVPRYFYTYNERYLEVAEDKYIYNVRYTPEKSYLMALELIKRGLPVLVRPIPVELKAIHKVMIDKDDNVITDPEGNIIVDDETSILKDFAFDEAANIFLAEDKALFITVDDAITNGALDDLTDKNIYNFKFITSGAYSNLGASDFVLTTVNDKPVYMNATAYTKMAELANKRGDCIAVLELKENIFNKNELNNLITDPNDADVGGFPDLSADFEKYKTSAAFTPWCEFQIEKTLPGYVANQKMTERVKLAKRFDTSLINTMPAGFAYLMAYAYSIQTNESWFAAAGVNRGQVPQIIKPLFEIGDAYMEELQGKGNAITKIRLNPIINTGSYGYRIWGNRVASPYRDPGGVYKTMYIEFLNVRMLLCDIKKQVYAAAIRTTFEPNDDITWVSFKVLCNNLLDRMKSGRGLLWYRWNKLVSEERATIKARLTIRPIEAVEAFDITVFLSDQDVEVEE